MLDARADHYRTTGSCRCLSLAALCNLNNVYVFILDRPPQPLGEDVVKGSFLTVHADSHPGSGHQRNVDSVDPNFTEKGNFRLETQQNGWEIPGGRSS